jgi:hypothetical protein
MALTKANGDNEGLGTIPIPSSFTGIAFAAVALDLYKR